MPPPTRSKKQVTKPKPETVTAKRLAVILGIADRTVRERAEHGEIIKASDGNYLLWESILGYINYIRTRKTNQHDSGDDAGDYEVNRARLTGAKADIAEMQAETMKGTVHEAGAVEAVWTDMLMNCRSKLLAMPTRLAHRLRQESDLALVQDILESAISEALHELSNYDPDRITGQYIQTHREDVDTSTEVDG